MTNQLRSFTEIVPQTPAPATSAPLDELIARLRSVRLKVGRWLPNADALAAWSVDYADVYAAANCLEKSVRALDTHLASFACDDLHLSAKQSVTLRMLLCDVEACADAFEQAVIDNLAGTN